MLEPDSPSRPFLGVHFLTFGFDPITERQVRSKLIDGSGVGVGQYSQSCTHVIVGRIVYDDPICVAARNDGKTVVTGLWVDHSFDIGMPVDATSIMYRPLRDLNGILGAKGLTVCLTGYQRQDREDIMIMVRLMGAQFSKPLVANKVTHLVCYKFEGEKYELAKKLKKIKLVNQRWLEDCLRDWELLPEANYNQSDYELEIMEAKAKDSDEEVGETATKQSPMGNIGSSPHDLKVRMLSATELPKSATEMPNPALPEDPSNAKSMEVSLTTGKLKSLFPSLNNLQISETQGCQETGASGNVASVEFLVQPQKSPNSTKLQMNLASSTENDDKFAAIYSRKTPCRSTLPDFSGETSGNTSGSSEAMELKDASDCYSPKLEEAKGRLSIHHTESPLKGSSPYHGEDSAGILPQKRVVDASITNSKLQKTSHNAKAPIITSPDLNVALASSVSAAKKPSNANEKLIKNDLTSFLTVSEENRQNENAEKSPMSCRELRESNSASKSSVGSLHTEGFSHAVKEPAVPENKEQDVDSFPSGRELEMGQSYGTVNWDSVEEGTNKLDGELPKTKMLSKKTLGRPKVSNIANKKCSIYTNKIASGNDPAICLNGVKERADCGSGSKEASPSTVSNDAVKEMTAKAVRNSAAKETKFMDDEAEAPDEKYKHEFKKTFNEEKSEFVDFAHKADVTVVTELSIDRSSATMHEDMVALENAADGTNLESAISNKKTKLGESISTVDLMKAESEAPDEKDKPEFEKSFNEKKSEFVDLPHKADRTMETQHLADPSRAATHEGIVASKNAATETNLESSICNKKTKLDESKSPENAAKVKAKQVQKHLSGNAKNKTIPAKSKKGLVAEGTRDGENLHDEKEKYGAKNNGSIVSANELNCVEEENRPVVDVGQNLSLGKSISDKPFTKSNKKQVKGDKICGKINSRRLPLQEVLNQVKCEPIWFIFSGHRYQRKEFQQVVKHLKGRYCRDSHQWSYQATHFIVPDPVRRTEKFFAAAASGRWILKTDYLSASSQAGKFLPEEPYEWHKIGLSEDGAINLEAPRKWRLLRERTGHGAFYGVRIIVYGECIAPPLDTLKRVVKAGDGTILATSPPYTRVLKSGIDFAVISPGMPRDDIWVQEFLKYEIPCIVTDYLVEYVCKPGFSLERHVLYNTQTWAQKSLASLVSRANETPEDLCTLPDDHQSEDIASQVPP